VLNTLIETIAYKVFISSAYPVESELVKIPLKSIKVFRVYNYLPIFHEPHQTD